MLEKDKIFLIRADSVMKELCWLGQWKFLQTPRRKRKSGVQEI